MRPTNLANEGEERLAREIGLFSAVSLGLGAMIGAGVFVLSGMAAGTAGPALILAFSLNGLIALIVGACYAELSTMMPRAGGAYVYAKPGLGPFLGFYAGWMSWFAQTIACSLYATAFGSFAITLFHSLTGRALGDGVATTIAVSALLAFSWLNYTSAEGTGRLEIVVTSLKIAVLLIVVAFGFFAIAGKPEPIAAFTPFFPEGGLGLLGAMGLTFIAFEGYEIIVQTAEEVERPSQTIPRAILISILIAVTLYILVAIVLLGAVTAPAGQSVYQYLGQLGELGLMEAAGQFVSGGKVVLLIAGLASTASALNATAYGSSRIALAMGRGGDLPTRLAGVHPKHRTPHVAIAVTCCVMIAVTLVLPIRDIAAATDIMFLLVFAMVCATVIRLRILWPDRDRPFRVPGSPWLPGIGILAGLLLSIGLIELSVLAWITAGGWLTLGGGVYLLRHGRRDGPN
jgi:APA family basic amino acid/polyamine antiporter